MPGGCEPLQYSRMSKHIRQIVFFAKPCPFVRHKFNRTNSVKKKIQVLLSGGEAPQQFTRASRHKRQIVFFAKPCPFVRHKFHRTNSEKRKFKFFCPTFLRKKSGRGRGRAALVALRRGRKTLFVLKAQERVNFLAAKRLKKRENPRRGFSIKSNNYFFVT